MNPILATGGMESVISDTTAAVAPYGAAAALLVGAVVAISIGIKWVKRFTSKAS